MINKTKLNVQEDGTHVDPEHGKNIDQEKGSNIDQGKNIDQEDGTNIDIEDAPNQEDDRARKVNLQYTNSDSFRPNFNPPKGFRAQEGRRSRRAKHLNLY